MWLHRKFLLCLLLVSASLTDSIAQAEDIYKVTVGGTMTGMREQKAQDVQLGLEEAFNQTISTDNMAVHIDIFDSLNNLAQSINQQKINAVFSSPLEYLALENDFLPTPFLCALINGACKSRIILLVRKDSAVNTLEQLKKKTLSIPKWILNDDGGLFLENLLLEKKQDAIPQFFSDVDTVTTTNKAITSLFFKKCDAALVRETEYNIAAELNPQLRQQLKIIESSEPLLMLTLGGLKNIDPDKLNILSKRLVHLSDSKKGKTVLGYMQITGFMEISPSELNSSKELLKKNKALKALKFNAGN